MGPVSSEGMAQRGARRRAEGRGAGDWKLECSFQVCAKLRNLKGGEGASARQAGKQRERKSNNYRKPDQEPEQGKPLRCGRCRKAGRRACKEAWELGSGSGEAESRSGLRVGGSQEMEPAKHRTIRERAIKMLTVES